ncbi:MAG: (d)CMP kinase [Rickettsiales bacterium]|jgi:cytidylate kinase|nr:(d)CMP kinase [Rickettsiales bacterium]
MNKIIAIDGTTASGKGTLAKKIASFYKLPYLNTGGLYRAIALYLADNPSIDLSDSNAIIGILAKVDFSDLENPELYNENISAMTSKIAIVPEVRKFLFSFQESFANQEGGAVLDGRDIGTVVCPHASFKFFITASVEERAKRRHREMLAKGKDIDYKEVLANLVERDRRDSERALAPLKKADDAVEVDTTDMGIDEVFPYVLSFIKF